MYRREFTKYLAPLAALLSGIPTSGCTRYQDLVPDWTPEEAESQIDWIPSVLRPVFYGYQDFNTMGFPAAFGYLPRSFEKQGFVL